MINNYKLQVEAISYGTVIDHIPAQVGFKLLKLFKLSETEERLTIGLNLPSSNLGKKDIIKIENIVLTEDQANQLAMYAPEATVNCIKNYKVIKKILLTLPKYINNVLFCPNCNCISHNENVSSEFIIKKINKEVILTCRFCEKEFDRDAVINSK